MPKHSPRRYGWPASKIDRDVMHELHQVSRHTGVPITDLVRDAVHAAMNARFENTPSHEAPAAPIGFIPPQMPRPAA